MKPIFTIHAGEYLVASEIEKRFPKYNVWVPSKDIGIDLLVTNEENSKSVSLQVKFSKDFNPTHAKDNIRPFIRGAGWWTLKRDKIEKSTADYWVFVLYSFEMRNHDYIIISPKKLLDIFDKIKRTENLVHCYIAVTQKKRAFETRGISKEEMEEITRGTFENNVRDLTGYLNNWAPIVHAL